jgi:hypothetical protein
VARLIEGSYCTKLPDGTSVLVPLTSLRHYVSRDEYKKLAGILIEAAQDARRHQEAIRTAKEWAR